MGRFRSGGLRLAVAILSLWGFAGCGGGKPGAPLFPGRITLTPSVNTSLELGETINFVASVQTVSGTNLNVPVTYVSSDTTILNIAPTGLACAGRWDPGFTTCIPGGTGPVTVTASAIGYSSVPIYVFVHPHIDNVTVTGILLTGVPIQEPCLSQSQSMTLEAHAFSQGTDITSSVGPFTWSVSNPTVASITPLINVAYSFATNQATATAVNPGIAYIYATASGVTSTSFQQPQFANSQGANSPVIDFFATCPIQNVTLEVGFAGSGQTSFVASSGGSEPIVATITDVMGNSSLPNTNGAVVLNKIPLTWTSSQPGVLAVTTGCNETCQSSTKSPGAGTLTASCSPPTCNIGFPLVPASLSSPAQVTACTQFFQPLAPNKSFNCGQLIPTPVYASTAISALVTGTPSTAAVLASSTGCAHVSPSNCITSAYSLTAFKASAGAETPIPASPNSFLYDPTGVKVYMGSDYGALVINPANFGSSTSPFTSLGTVTGSVLAVSNSGLIAAFADTIHTPNQVYIANSATTTTPTALNISGATAAAFSPDGLKTLIVGGTGGSSLYIYSPLQALQGPISLSGPGNSVAFSPNSAFGFVAEDSTTTTSANLTAFATCNNQLAATVPLPASPLMMKALPNVHLDGQDSYGNSIPDGIHILVLDDTGFDIVTASISPPASGALCPQTLTFISGDPLRPTQRVELGQGTLQPLNFFATADGSQLYVVNSNSSTIVVYNFLVGSTIGGIPLLNNATPVSADITVDGGTIMISGNDGILHEVSTQLGGADLFQLPFPNLPNYLNAFCTYTPTAGPCALNLAVVKP